jgi:Domain of unknown function (DUF932)
LVIKNNIIFVFIKQNKMINIKQKTQDILTEYGLDFNIVKLPMMCHYGSENIISPYYGLLNDKTKEVINSVKVGYTITQNKEVIERVLSGMVKFGDDLRVTKAGSLDGGRRIFVQLEITGKSKVGTDVITRYVTITDSNDGTTSFSVGIGDEVARCTNQFYKFYAKGTSKFRHSASITQKLNEVPNLIELALETSMKQIKTYQRFLSSPLTKRLANSVVCSMVKYDRSMSAAELSKISTRTLKMMDSIYDCIDDQCAAVGDNVWGLFNGVTKYTTHELKVNQRENARLQSLMIGNGYLKAHKAMTVLEKALA